MKTVIYRDPLKDDFSTADIQTQPVPASFRYRHGWLWNAVSALLYRGIATPVAELHMRVLWGIKMVGREKLRTVSGGYFLYGNHTRMAGDAFLPSVLSFPRRMQIMTGADAVSGPVLSQIVPMLGGMPLAETIGGAAAMQQAIHDFLQEGRAIMLYPEAHIWPYCTFIRPYTAGAFRYPVKENAPVFTSTVTYRPRRMGGHAVKRPGITVYIDGPFYPDPSLPLRPAMEKLRDEAYAAQCRRAEQEPQQEFVRYVQADDAPPTPH